MVIIVSLLGKPCPNSDIYDTWIQENTMMALPIIVNYPISSQIPSVMPGSDLTVPSRVTSKGIKCKTSPLDVKF